MDITDQNSNRRERIAMVAQLGGLSLGVAALLIAVTNFLGILATECASGTPHLTAIFVCFPGH